MPYNLQSYGISDIGLVRTNNEDVWAQNLEHHFFVLADGMGGHKAGEIAAREAVASLCDHLNQLLSAQPEESTSVDEVKQCLVSAFETANAWVYHLSESNEAFRGMGTTLCCFLLFERTLIYAHVGDSRVYRFREGTLEQLTQDHSLRSELIAKGQLDAELASSFPYKNIITRAIGTSPSVCTEIHQTAVLPHDLYFLCSDGLTDHVTHAEIAHILNTSHTIKEASEHLVSCAKNKGGTDNITIVMIEILP